MYTTLIITLKQNFIYEYTK